MPQPPRPVVGPPHVRVLPPGDREDEESDFPPVVGPVSDLRALPPHVRRAMRREGVTVRYPRENEFEGIARTAREPQFGNIAGLYNTESKEAAFYHGNLPHHLFAPGKGGPLTNVGRHEFAGHAADAMMRGLDPRLSSDSARFQAICRKYQAGTPGGGGGMGEFTADYEKSRCDELYATLLAVYYSDRASLCKVDPIACQFMREVDAVLYARGKSKSVPPVPPIVGAK